MSETSVLPETLLARVRPVAMMEVSPSVLLLIVSEAGIEWCGASSRPVPSRFSQLANGGRLPRA